MATKKMKMKRLTLKTGRGMLDTMKGLFGRML
jgi:hypothetical protein